MRRSQPEKCDLVPALHLCNNACLSRIRRLPTEMLKKTILHAIEDPQDSRMLYTVSLVCCHWRNMYITGMQRVMVPKMKYCDDLELLSSLPQDVCVRSIQTRCYS